MTALLKRHLRGYGDNRVQVHLLPPLKDQLTWGFIPIRRIREIFPRMQKTHDRPPPSRTHRASSISTQKYSI